ncbi:hypothetical protein K1719_018411 [Acacia pycnantha]|nr:hypothetical protein K1719_018411 [Acacia pycnantha]
MGCLCSKDKNEVDECDKEEDLAKSSSVQLVPPALSTAQLGGGADTDGSVNRLLKKYSHTNVNNHSVVETKPIKGQYQRPASFDASVGEGKGWMSRILSMSKGSEAEHVAAGWPLWLSSVAGDAIKGLVPRRLDSFEKLGQVGQGAYSSVHKALDLLTGKIVALKKVRFSPSDAESVRFMAREIYILRQLDHPNVMKLEGIVTSRTSSSLYLVFEYMEHDLAGLEALPGMKFTESQIKCYMKQLLCGLEHCHSHGILHRDIKGSNLLLNSEGILQIGDFGLSTIYQTDNDYGPAVDLWSAGCILAELLVGKPTMPGRTEVEQMHKILSSVVPQVKTLALVEKLLAIEPEDRGSATSALQSEFFTTPPLPCDPSSLPKFPPSKEYDAKLRDEEARRKNTESVKRHEPASVARGARDTNALRSPEYNAKGNISVQVSSNAKTSSGKYTSSEDGSSHFRIVPGRGSVQNSHDHPTWGRQIAATGSPLNKRSDSREKNKELRTQRSNVNQAAADFSNSYINKGYMPKKNRMHHSGPLVPPGANIDDMLREHERLMQEAFRTVKDKNNHKNTCNKKNQLHII